MKKIFIIAFLFISFVGYSQTSKVYNSQYSNGVFGKPDTLVSYPLSNTTKKYFTGYGTWGNLLDTISVRQTPATLQKDTISLMVFGGGGANSDDTSVFTTSTMYGSLWTAITDTFVITKMVIGLQGTSPSVLVRVYWSATLGSGSPTSLTASGTTATNTTTGTIVTTFSNSKIPPGNFIWCTTPTVTTKPTFMTVTLIGYKSRVQ